MLVKEAPGCSSGSIYFYNTHCLPCKQTDIFVCECVCAQYEISFRLKDLVAKYFKIEVLGIISNVKLKHLSEISNEVIECSGYLPLLHKRRVESCGYSPPFRIWCIILGVLYRVNLAPVPLTIFRSNSKFDQNLQCCSSKCHLPITTKFCTRHDSVTVVTCAKFHCDRLSMF